MGALYMIIGTLVALGVLVTFHEFGHFWVARRCGVKVLRFSVGFGSPLVRWHDRHGTEFVIAAIPLGGYVKMLDEREGDVPPALLDSAFNRKTVRQRFAIVSAGPLAFSLWCSSGSWQCSAVSRCVQWLGLWSPAASPRRPGWRSIRRSSRSTASPSVAGVRSTCSWYGAWAKAVSST